jgi:hypothetical protein
VAHLERSFNHGLRVVIDLGYGETNSAREANSLARQLTYLYSAIKREASKMGRRFRFREHRRKGFLSSSMNFSNVLKTLILNAR